jgi:hypothetical protein
VYGINTLFHLSIESFSGVIAEPIADVDTGRLFQPSVSRSGVLLRVMQMMEGNRRADKRYSAPKKPEM